MKLFDVWNLKFTLKSTYISRTQPNFLSASGSSFMLMETFAHVGAIFSNWLYSQKKNTAIRTRTCKYWIREIDLKSPHMYLWKCCPNICLVKSAGETGWLRWLHYEKGWKYLLDNDWGIANGVNVCDWSQFFWIKLPQDLLIFLWCDVEERKGSRHVLSC